MMLCSGAYASLIKGVNVDFETAGSIIGYLREKQGLNKLEFEYIWGEDEYYCGCNLNESFEDLTDVLSIPLEKGGN